MIEWAWVLTLPLVLAHRCCSASSGARRSWASSRRPWTRTSIPPPAAPNPAEPSPGRRRLPEAAADRDHKPPNYRKYILGEQPNPGLVNAFLGGSPTALHVIAYWRLVDAAASGDAVDEKAFQKGDYEAGPHLCPRST